MTELPVIETGTRCRNLLSKGTFINHGLPPARKSPATGISGAAKRSGILGPDKKLCDLKPCCDSSRSCYEG